VSWCIEVEVLAEISRLVCCFADDRITGFTQVIARPSCKPILPGVGAIDKSL